MWIAPSGLFIGDVMAFTEDNITIPSTEWVNLNELSGLSTSESIVIFNTGSNDIKLVVSADKPFVDTEAFIYITPRREPFISNNADCCPVWAYSVNTIGSLNVSSAKYLMPANSISHEQPDKSSNGYLLESICHLLKLLNARFEEAFETRIKSEDIDNADSGR